MKVAIGQRFQEGPWGGGNNFIRTLAEALKARGDTVVHDLSADVDIALITDPRARNPLITFTPGCVLRHLVRHPRTLVVHRINECDERKGTHSMNRRLRLANYAADHTVFIASWLEWLPIWRRESERSVILNGADGSVFHSAGQEPWDGKGKFRFVTHHWGASRMKGFDVYERLDALLDTPDWGDRFAFTYIGNLPSGMKFRNTRHVEPLAGAPLAAELRRHHAYLTASINEPAGMHHIEGALSGLPLVYRNSGALPEYCAEFGEVFEGPDDFMDAITRMTRNYEQWRSRLAQYPHTADRMAARYLELFEDLLTRRDSIIAARRLWRGTVAFALNQIPL